MRNVGKGIQKKDAMSLVTGKPVYTDDLAPKDCLVVKVLHSPHAFAKIKSINTTIAKRIPGIEAVFTYEDVPKARFTMAGQSYPELSPYDRYILEDVVRYVGDDVAIVAGVDEDCVDRALKAIKIDYEVLEPVLDFTKALDYCTQGMKGKVLKLNIDDFGYLNDCYVSCRFKKSMEQQMAHQSKFRLSHMSEADYLIDLNDDSFQKAIQDSDYAQVYNGVVGSIALNKGVYLYGNPGVGKSYLLKGVSNYYAKNGKSVSFVQVPLLIQELKQFMTDNEYRQNLLGHLRFSDVLILDDIGAESITQWTRDEILLPVLDQRMNNNLKTYFTSNYSLEELEQQYRACSKMNGNVASLRILERIRTLSNPISLMGKSRRS